MEDRRHQKRKNVSYSLDVYDDESGKLLGKLVDFSRCGLRLLTEDPLETGAMFLLRIDLPKSGANPQAVRIKARSVWLEQDFSSNAFNSGFSIEEMSKKTFEAVDKLVHHSKI